MTDEQIIKALECCGNQMFSCTDKQCKAKVMGDALDLVNRQKAEIERLNSILKFVRGTVTRAKSYIETLDEKINKCRTEAIKVFAKKVLERLDNEALTKFEMYDGYDIQDTKRIVNNLVKEMTEGE